MKNNKTKIALIALIAVLLLICVILIILKGKNTDKNPNINISITKSEEKKYENIKTYEEYAIVKNIINRYLVYNSLKDTGVIYDMLDKDFIKENNITKQNIKGKIKQTDKTECIITEISCLELNDYNSKYKVKCNIYSIPEDEDDNEEIIQRDYEKKEFTILIDKFNTTFSITPEE